MTHCVFLQLSLDDEPSAYGTYTASGAATELPYSGKGLLAALVLVVWSMHCIGRSNCNGCNTRWIHHDLLTLCCVFLPDKLPNQKIRLRSGMRKCFPHTTTKPESYVGNNTMEQFVTRSLHLQWMIWAKLALRRCTEGEASDVVRSQSAFFVR